MKKVLLVFFMAVSAIMLFASTSFAEATYGDVVVHFQRWNGDYSDIGVNSWGDGAVPGMQNPDDAPWVVDDFGVHILMENVTVYEAGVTEGAIGFQVVVNIGSAGAWTAFDWTQKLANFEIPRESVVAGKTLHVYAFEGSVNRETDIPSADYADPIFANSDAQGMLIVYFDPSNSYEENLGVHSWGWADGFNASGWNVPLEIFQPVGRTSDGTAVMAGIMEYADPMGTPGAIVYYGDGDGSKKTNNLEPANETNEAYIATPKAVGELDMVYVLNKGNGNVSNNNVWVNDPVTFAAEAFTFRIADFKVDEETGAFSGTYAVDPNTIIVKLSSLLPNPYEAAVTAQEQEDAIAAIESWFTVREITGVDTFGTPLVIERVDFAKSNETIDTFVVILESAGLDNTLQYQLDFNDLLTENPHVADIEIVMDAQAPVLTFISPTAIIGQPAASRIIEVAWGQPFDQNLFPGYRVADDRDGDLTPFVYVPSGDYSTLDTRTEGDYTIMLMVEDKWGNVTSETFIFRVTKGE